MPVSMIAMAVPCPWPRGVVQEAAAFTRRMPHGCSGSGVAAGLRPLMRLRMSFAASPHPN